MRTIIATYDRITPAAWARLQDAVLLLQRFIIAHVFFVSGLTKIGDWNNTLALFETEYQVPLLPVPFAAFSATLFELVCPVLLAIGLGTRWATLPLLVMTAVIQFTYDQNPQHTFWALLLVSLFAFGAGRFSVDQLIRCWLSRECHSPSRHKPS